MDSIRAVLDSAVFLWLWAFSSAVAWALLTYDLWMKNRGLMPLMRVVWLLTVAYSGLLGLAIYFFAGRAQIPRDDLARKSFRSVAHCYSGCGAGEIVGVWLALGLLGLSQLWVALVTFILAYCSGVALTVGPLLQDGVPPRRALRDAVYSETASIVVMEATAISVGLWLGGNSGLGDARFWSSIVVSLSLGLVVAYPVNVWLIHRGVKEGMHDPRHHQRGDSHEAGSEHGSAQQGHAQHS